MALPQGDRQSSRADVIGFASEMIEAGEHVHVHNLTMGDFARDYAFSHDVKSEQPLIDMSLCS